MADTACEVTDAELLRELNRARTDPRAVAASIEERLRHFRGADYFPPARGGKTAVPSSVDMHMPSSVDMHAHRHAHVRRTPCHSSRYAYWPPACCTYQPRACRTVPLCLAHGRSLSFTPPPSRVAPQVPSKEGAAAVREAARALHNLSPLPPLVLQADGQVRRHCSFLGGGDQRPCRHGPTACALHVHCMCTACALHVHCMCTCMCTACAPHISHAHCTHPVHAPGPSVSRGGPPGRPRRERPCRAPGCGWILGEG